MVSVDLADYYAAGYVLIRANPPEWEHLKETLKSEKLISLSTCICPMRFSINWGWIPGNQDNALEFGISEDRIDKFFEWCRGDANEELIMYSLFKSAKFAQQFVERFIDDTHDLHLIGIGLQKDRRQEWVNDPERNNRLDSRIKKGVLMESGGTPLGFEVVSYAYHDFNHSWLCSGLEVDMKELFGIESNKHGLIDSYTEAKQVSDWIAEEPGRRGEPEPYDFWLLVDYPLQSAED